MTHENTTPDGVPSIIDHPNYVAAQKENPQAASDQIHEDVAVPVDAEPVENAVAFGLHVMMMNDGQFAVVPTGNPNVMEAEMLLSRAQKMAFARMVAAEVVGLQEQQRSTKRIVGLDGEPA